MELKINELFKHERKMALLSQLGLSQLLSLGKGGVTSISRIENNKMKISRKMAIKLQQSGKFPLTIERYFVN